MAKTPLTDWLTDIVTDLLAGLYIMVLVPSKTFSITVRAPDLVLEALKSLYN
jgi:hypothetical protein